MEFKLFHKKASGIKTLKYKTINVSINEYIFNTNRCINCTYKIKKYNC